MIIQTGLRKNVSHKRYRIGAHPIIQRFMDKLKVNEIMGSYLSQHQRRALPLEKTLSVIIHNILTNSSPMYEFSDWLKPLDEEKLDLDSNEASLINDDRLSKKAYQLMEQFPGPSSGAFFVIITGTFLHDH